MANRLEAVDQLFGVWFSPVEQRRGVLVVPFVKNESVRQLEVGQQLGGSQPFFLAGISCLW